MSTARALVLDTNVVLDWLVWDDPRAWPLAQAVQAGRWRWLATAAMRAEFGRVLTYPRIAARLAATGRRPDELLAAFDRHHAPAEAAPPAPWRCADPDDQPFLDLAHAHAAALASRDLSLLSLAKRALPLVFIGPPAMFFIAT